MWPCWTESQILSLLFFSVFQDLLHADLLQVQRLGTREWIKFSRPMKWFPIQFYCCASWLTSQALGVIYCWAGCIGKLSAHFCSRQWWLDNICSTKQIWGWVLITVQRSTYSLTLNINYSVMATRVLHVGVKLRNLSPQGHLLIRVCYLGANIL